MAANKMTPEDLKAIKNRVGEGKKLRKDGTVGRITVHMSTCGLASGAQNIMDRLLQEISECGRSDIAIGRSGCIGLCNREPLVTVELLGQEPVIYQRVDDQKAQQIFKQNLLGGKVQVDLALARGKAVNEEPMPNKSALEGIIPHISQLKFFALQQSLVLHNKGLIDPDRIDDYIWRDGYLAAAKALLEMTTSEIISEVKISGLRGRGDGGFPTGIMLEFCANSREDVRYVLCAADEADPGAFVSRSVMEADPHAVLEGMIIAAKAIGAHQGYIYCRAEYSLAVEKLNLAIDQARTHGLLGKDILNSGFDFDIEVHQGAGASVCGEKTALMGAIEGGRGMPRPPLPAALGLWKKPTLHNNAETYINLPRIILLGGEAYADIGTESSKGTKLFSLTGKVNNTGLVEVPMGTSVGEIVFDIGGGIPLRKKFKAVQLGGPSGACIPPEHLNIPIDYDALAKVGAIMGSGGMTVIDEDTCVVDMVRSFMNFCQDEVSDQSISCRVETKRMTEILQRISQGKGRGGDIEGLEDLAQKIRDTAFCALGKTAPNLILSTIRYFRHEYEAHILDKHCPAAVCSKLFKSPCQHLCPVCMDAPAYIALIRAGRLDDAYKVLKRTNPFPSVCGRVCGHDCQTKCRRGQLDEPVAIMHLKRFITDNARRPKAEPLPIIRKEKVAIIGTGPSGLTAALELKKRGYGVTVYEALPEAGGMLRWGIPAYRLPRNELDREIEDILQTGVQLQTNTRVGRDITFEELDRNFDIIYLATGAQKSFSLNIPGEDAEGVFGAVEFLRAYHLGRGIKVGKKKVAVIGGGISAVDAARTAIRLGAKKVTLYYRRERNDMPVQAWNIKAAEEEGVRIMDQVAPVRVITQYGKVTGLELTQTRPGKFDQSARRQPKPILGSEFIEKAEMVIFAIGRVADLDFLSTGSGIERNQTTIKVDKNLHTTHAKVWAGGDVVTGPAMVVDAIKAGQIAARAIDTSIRVTHGEKPWIAPAEEMIDIPLRVHEEPVQQLQIPMPEAQPKVRRTDFREVKLGYTLEMARAEACRCLRCDATGGFDDSAQLFPKGDNMATKGEILLVDDDPDFRDSLLIILENHGYTVRIATNGTEALEALKVKRPDLMILDVMMATDTEGFDLAYDLKKKPGFKDLPIILLTSFLEKVRKEGPDKFQHITGEEWPARWMFEKPVDTKKLIAKIEGILAGG